MSGMTRIAAENIGFAIVKRRFASGGVNYVPGSETGELSREFLLAMPPANRDAMVDARQIEIYPRSVLRSGGAPPKGEKHLVTRGFGKYDVIQGSIIGTGMTKEAALALIGVETSPAVEDEQMSAPVSAKRKPRSMKGGKKAKRKKVARKNSPRSPKRSNEDEQPNGPIV